MICFREFTRCVLVLAVCVSVSGLVVPANVEAFYGENPDDVYFHLASASVGILWTLAFGTIALAVHWALVALFARPDPRFEKLPTYLLAVAGILWCSATFSFAFDFDLSNYSEPYCTLAYPQNFSGPEAFGFDGGCSLTRSWHGALTLVTVCSLSLLGSLVARTISKDTENESPY